MVKNATPSILDTTEEIFTISIFDCYIYKSVILNSSILRCKKIIINKVGVLYIIKTKESGHSNGNFGNYDVCDLTIYIKRK